MRDVRADTGVYTSSSLTDGGAGYHQPQRGTTRPVRCIAVLGELVLRQRTNRNRAEHVHLTARNQNDSANELERRYRVPIRLEGGAGSQC